MSRILFLCNSSTGLYDFRGDLIRALISGGHEVIVSLPDDTRRKDLEAEGCKFIHTDINRRGMDPRQDLRLIRDYKGILKDERPDVVLTYTIKPNIFKNLLINRR